MNLSKKGDKVVYLYIHNFEYEDGSIKDSYSGHPKPNRVYQAIKNNGTWRIPLDNDQTDGILLHKLNVDKKESLPWACEIEEIDDTNISSLPIDIEDMKNLVKWEEIENKNIEHHMLDYTPEDEELVELDEEEMDELLEKVGVDESSDSLLQIAVALAVEGWIDTRNPKYLIGALTIIKNQLRKSTL